MSETPLLLEPHGGRVGSKSLSCAHLRLRPYSSNSLGRLRFKKVLGSSVFQYFGQPRRRYEKIAESPQRKPPQDDYRKHLDKRSRTTTTGLDATQSTLSSRSATSFDVSEASFWDEESFSRSCLWTRPPVEVDIIPEEPEETEQQVHEEASFHLQQEEAFHFDPETARLLPIPTSSTRPIPPSELSKEQTAAAPGTVTSAKEQEEVCPTNGGDDNSPHSWNWLLAEALSEDDRDCPATVDEQGFPITVESLALKAFDDCFARLSVSNS